MTDKTRPDYYKAADGGDVLDFILRFKLPFAEGCVVKYIARSVSGKPGTTRLDDLMKAKEYIERLIELERMRTAGMIMCDLTALSPYSVPQQPEKAK